ncbi:MAG: PadR family transcriptional regulator, partial [Actinomycetota bacterium]|nr:PadR family transcriptional regulator [Actinomycetota bacterium]
FARTDAEVRLRILEGRRSRLEERCARIKASATRTRERLDAYTLELQRHGLESVEGEVRWLNEIIRSERAQTTHDRPDGIATPSDTTTRFNENRQDA